MPHSSPLADSRSAAETQRSPCAPGGKPSCFLKKKRRVIWLSALLVLTLICLSPSAGSQSRVKFSQEEVKAAFLYQFAHFVRWPGGAFQSDDTPFTFCGVQSNPVMTALAQAVEGEQWQGRKMQVVVLDQPDEALFSSCQILYIGAASLSVIHDEEAVHTHPTLIVGDHDFAWQDGHIITLTLRDGRVHPIIHIANARRVDLAISAKLLRLATVVGDEK